MTTLDANPLLEGWSQRDQVRGLLGMAATLAFAAVDMALWVRARTDRAHLAVDPSLRAALVYVASLVGLGLLMLPPRLRCDERQRAPPPAH